LCTRQAQPTRLLGVKVLYKRKRSVERVLMAFLTGECLAVFP
jgi:hypothetical protein